MELFNLLPSSKLKPSFISKYLVWLFTEFKNKNLLESFKVNILHNYFLKFVGKKAKKLVN